MKRLILFLLLFAGFVQSADTGFLNGSSFSTDGTATDWGNPTNAQYSDNSYATVTAAKKVAADSSGLVAQGYGFSIPAGAIVNGIQFDIERKFAGAGCSVSDRHVWLTKDGTYGYASGNSNSWGTSDSYNTFGSSSNLWSTTWTPAEINSADFGGAISISVVAGALASCVASIDHMRIKVYYAPAGGAPEINFSSQTPADINTYNVVGTAVNLTYNISANGTGRSLNTSTVLLFHKTNTTTSNCWYYTNGTQTCGWVSSEVQTSNVSNVWQFLLKDNAIYPATYSLDQAYMETAAKSVQTISNQNNYYKIRLLNVSASRQYGFFEAYANATSGTRPLRIYYCNSSYTNGLISISNYCAELSAIVASSAYNHSHTSASWHYVAPFGINLTAGTINGIKITETSYFLLRGNTGTDWGVYYISNVTATNAMQTSGDGGNAWSNFAGTADAHLHQFNGNDTFYYFVQACDNSTPANCTNSTVRSDLMQLGGMPPTAPFVYSPAFNSTYLNNSLININYTESISPNAYNISYYNITLRNANLSFNKTIYANNSQNLSYAWDSTGTPAGEYVIGVEAKDQNNQTTVGYSGEFTLVAVSTCGTITQNYINGPAYMHINMMVPRGIIMPEIVREWITWSVSWQ